MGFFGYIFISFVIGNQFAIYSDVTVPELRGTVNALSGIMLNIGGITENVIVSAFVQNNFLSLSITLILVMWLVGSFSWIIPYFYYLEESELRRLTILTREKDLRVQVV